ncbi:MAG TPA: hypothetical protein VKU80_05825, partial [Planctomycetota bacterium]|nr:hypothetical protein [Planctomycetota bacterium]
LVFVATQHDSVYAVDADLGVQVWTVSFLSTNVTTVPYTDVGSSDITPEIGITSTPVIDPAAQILYVLAKTKEGPGPAYTYVQRLHALDLATGAEMLGGPVVIQASVPGTGDGSVGGVVSFDPLRNGQRSALLLLGGTLYIAWASHGDTPIYHGWVMGYDAHTLSQVSVWCASPNNPTAGSTPGQAAIWMDGGGLATDGTFLYFSTGNGYFDANSLSASNTEYGDSFVKLSTAGGSLVVADYFTPFNQASLSSGDLDLGSGGVVLLPDQGGAHPHLMLGGGKQALIYLIDRDNLGQFNASTDQVVQTVDLAALGITYTPISPSTGTAPGIFSTPAYFNGTIYYKPAAPDVSVNCASPLLAFPVSGGLLSTSPIQSSPTWGWPGSTPSISANGVANGIVWALDVGPALTNAVLHAFKASDLTELYNSTQNAGDALGKGVKFTVPTVANGKVYVGTAATLAIYGLK